MNIQDMQLEMRVVPINKLNPAKYNPRKDLKPGDPEYEKIKRSLNQFGYVDPIIWNEDTGNIVGGHQRYKILKAEGAKELQVVVVHKNSNDEKALNVALNKASGEWDEANLIALMEDLNAENYDLTSTAFSPDEIAVLLNLNDGSGGKEAKDDDFDVEEATGIEPFVQNGDVWILGRHRLMCGDSTSSEAVKQLMNGQVANACITDPPYNCNYTGKTSDALKIMNDHFDTSKQFYDFLLAAMTAAYENLCDGGALYVFYADAEKVNFFNATVDAGFHYSTTCVWVKNVFVMGHKDYQTKHEPILYAFKDTMAHKWYGDRKQTSVWEFDRPSAAKLHPTMKPLPLIAYPMKMSTQENGIVLDLFGGSGSTLIAAEQINRKAYLMELDPRYASAIVLRYIASQKGDISGIKVVRDGTEYSCGDVCNPFDMGFDFKEGSVNDESKNKKGNKGEA